MNFGQKPVLSTCAIDFGLIFRHVRCSCAVIYNRASVTYLARKNSSVTIGIFWWKLQGLSQSKVISLHYIMVLCMSTVFHVLSIFKPFLWIQIVMEYCEVTYSQFMSGKDSFEDMEEDLAQKLRMFNSLRLCSCNTHCKTRNFGWN